MKKQRRYAPWFRRQWGWTCPATGYNIVELELDQPNPVDGAMVGYEIETPEGYYLLGDALSTIAEVPGLMKTAHAEYAHQKKQLAA